MMKKQRLFPVLVLFFLGACSPTSTPAAPGPSPAAPTRTPAADPPTATADPTRTATAIATATRRPTVTSAPSPTASPSPTGGPVPAQLVFEYTSSSGIQLRQIGIDGNGEKTLTTLARGAFSLDVSPDGRFVLFDAICPLPTSVITAVYLFDLSTLATSLLTDCGGVEESTPAWSPDGRQIAMTVNLGPDVSSTPWEIFVFDADGSDPIQLTDNLRRDGNPTWSPGGELIAFQATVGTVGWEIFTIDVESGAQVRLTENDEWDSSPAWSPDGSRIAFISDRDGNFEVYTMKANGDDPIRLTNTSAREFSPVWSPDGTMIAFVSERDGNSEIYVMNADGSGVVRVTNHPDGWSDHPDWLPMDPAAGDPTPTAGPSPTPHCAAGWSRLEPGDIAVVAGDADDAPNRVRAEPNTSAEITVLIYPGLEIEILDGPVCADGLVFWKVASSEIPGGEGWTAEGDGTEYWLEPKNP